MNDDTISRQAAYNTLSKYYHHRTDTQHKSLREALDLVPSVQPEIIVCADCKHWVCHDRRCGYWNHGVKPLDWCSYAERREDE